VLHRRATPARAHEDPGLPRRPARHGDHRLGAILNGLKLVGKDIAGVKVAVSGAGAAALACLDLLVKLGLRPDNIRVSDIKGVVYKGRTEEMDPEKARYARDTRARTLAEIVPGADVFLGLSAGGVLKPEMIAGMASRPLILALANPEPEIRPELAQQVRPDAILCTGRSDYSNQVNNVLCFPSSFAARWMSVPPSSTTP
jgi:malate dehydrogenase (oxaloacetate-decarboxylating)(NADP+)